MQSLRKFLWTCALAGVSTLAHAAVGTGTGFVITRQGHIATNFHVIEGWKKISVKDSADRIFNASVVLTDPNNDLAILQIDDTSHPALPIKSSASMKKGAPVFTLGFPNPGTQGIESKVTEGIISSLSSIRGRPNSFQISVPIQPGNSGGPLLDLTGSVVGLTTAKLSADYMLEIGGQIPENVNYAVKSNYLIELVRTNENIGSKITLSTSEKPLPLPSLVAAAEKSVMFIRVELADRQTKSAEKPFQPSEKNGVEPKYVSDALAIKFYNDGLAFYNAQKYAEALVNFGEAASRGHINAQFHMGEIYYYGKGVSINYREAFSWLKKSAEQGLPQGQHSVCLMYHHGYGVEKSDIEAAKWCESAAKNGDALAQRELGLMYARGIGVTKDDAKAFEWMRKAVDGGNPDADHLLGGMYFLGTGTPQNYAEAFILLSRAAKRGQAIAQFFLALMYDEGRGIPVDLDQAFRWFRDSANQGNSNAQIGIARAFEFGRGVAQDTNQAIAWYQKSAAQGNGDAKVRLQALLERQKNASPRVAIGDVVEVNLAYGFAVVKTNQSIPENTPLVMDIAGSNIKAKAARQAGEKLSITLDGTAVTTGIVGARVYRNP